jgi:ABC-type amino acid transport substrate-binding protein
MEVIGVRERVPRKHPEVFDPVNDERWRAGFRETFPTEIPEELKGADALTRTRKMGRIVACADGWYYPFSATAPSSEPPGIDVEILRAIAKRNGWRSDIIWANTGINLGLAFRNTIDRGYCDFFMGLTITGEDTDIERHHLTFTDPYVGLGFVLAVQGKAENLRTLEDVRAAKLRVGVLMFSPMEEYVRANQIAHELYYQNQRLIDGMVKGEVDAGMIWSGALAVARKKYDVDFKMVPGYVPPVGQRWNGAWALPEKEKPMREFLNQELGRMLQEGEIRHIVESYHVPFFPPFPN